MVHVTEDQAYEIERMREGPKHKTLRPTSPALENIMFQVFPVLDHGFVRVVDYLGDQSSIISAARISYGRGTTTKSSDDALLRYLISHHHTTPLEMTNIKLHIKMPIFVARQMIRHRMSSVNEYSARYSILDNEFYIPDIENIAPQSTDNKQGRAGELNRDQALAVQALLREDAEQAYSHYLVALGEKDQPWRPGSGVLSSEFPERTLMKDTEFHGIARELARMNLSLNFYTQWIWKIDGNNLLKMLALREDSHAQYEIRVYAEIISNILKIWMPDVHLAYRDYMKDAFNLSKPMQKTLMAFVKFMMETDYVTVQSAITDFFGNRTNTKNDRLSQREINALKSILEANAAD